jgi:exodeoxyribonuclease V alpha subunit
MQHYLLLQRNLLYTAVTRGEAFVVIVGQAKALEAAVRNASTKRRFGGLLARLRNITA